MASWTPAVDGYIERIEGVLSALKHNSLSLIQSKVRYPYEDDPRRNRDLKREMEMARPSTDLLSQQGIAAAL